MLKRILVASIVAILATLAATQIALKKSGYTPKGDGVMAAGEVLG